MKLIVGLGNPGVMYENTRHNAGFIALKYIAKKHNLEFSKSHGEARIAEGKIARFEVLLARPQTYMNLSGKAVKKLMNKYHLGIDDIIVIHDDLDLPVGKMRIKKGGGTGGHNGLESLNAELGNASYARLKIGIGRPQYSGQVKDYVLSRFTSDEREVVEGILPLINDAIIEFLRFGAVSAANKFNADPQEKKAKNEYEVLVYKDTDSAYKLKITDPQGQLIENTDSFKTLEEAQKSAKNKIIELKKAQKELNLLKAKEKLSELPAPDTLAALEAPEDLSKLRAPIDLPKLDAPPIKEKIKAPKKLTEIQAPEKLVEIKSPAPKKEEK